MSCVNGLKQIGRVLNKQLLLYFYQLTLLEVCVGRDSFEGLSKEEILAQLNDTLCGCSRIAGNLVIDLSADKSAEVASEQLIFLNTIVEVTGYVHLKGIQVLDYLLLPWLRVIQGRSLLSGHALVIEDVTAPGGLLFPSLTQIPEGGVLQSGFRGHCSNVSWNVILSGQNVLTESSDVVCENGKLWAIMYCIDGASLKT